jgi:excisionase family DNA binding protein
MIIKDGEKYYTVAEIAQVLCRSRVTVFRYIKQGKLKATKIGHDYYVSYSDYASYFFHHEMTKEFQKEFTKLTLKLIDDVREMHLAQLVVEQENIEQLEMPDKSLQDDTD